ncbi:glycoside hydrolase family 9 protein [Vibrio agarivorans]|uniref:Glycoside hydrolase family 9 protein n=1 Tax=Vibrio agarivorans TaxID=153622 RepID=A0ABT7XWZ1_9VIBR|nr:glycoside hydrolase family 9 protein [Vibrio agarivorans]MDN2480294.1 glycoside hydrolase family 9 protein [Vibrio agarivorans]
MQLLINHIGYAPESPKHAVVMLESGDAIKVVEVVELVCAKTNQVMARVSTAPAVQCDNWHQGHFADIDFSHFAQTGEYYLQAGQCQSARFSIAQGLVFKRTFSDLLHYFKSQRCSGRFDQQDHSIPLLSTQETLDVHGGWYDASGDVSKYLSHLSYANYLNPQQTPMVVWNMLKAAALLEDNPDLANFSATRLLDEALFGADFLYRMQHPDGFFCMTVFDKWSKETNQREICAYSTQEGHKSAQYQAGFRQGAGISIAALALTSRMQQAGDYTSEDYLVAAEQGYHHLKTHNLQYLDDGCENIIDEYCALLAATELYKATDIDFYLNEARYWAQALMERQQSDQDVEHFWAANDDGSRPYYHASEAGLPVIALAEFLSIESGSTLANQVKDVIRNACQFELNITHRVANPFGYPRQYVKGVNEDKRDAFFIAHDNESGYWWQGENARLASLASMAWLAQPYIDDESLLQGLEHYAQHAMNWILGLNPYDMCMLDGHGHNNPDYLPHLGFFNARGGVCNGITAGFEDEHDIAFNPEPHKDDMLQNWRWGEQWIPHAGWLLLAISAQHTLSQGAK